MTTIRATCPECGEVDLTPEEIELTVVRAADEAVGPDSHYSFLCPSCDNQVHKPADERIARLLTTSGVAINVVGAVEEIPAGPHPESPPAGPPLSYDDLIDFHFLLERPDWFALVRGMSRHPAAA